MGFLGFFEKIGRGIAHGFKKVGRGIASAGKWVYHKAIKPVGNFTYNKVLKPVGQGIAKGATFAYDKVIKPAGNFIGKQAEKAWNRFEKVQDAAVAGVSGLGKAADGLGSFLQNPLNVLLIGGGAIIAISYLKK